jgi:hypothetical protein
MKKPPEPMPAGVIGYAHATLCYTPELLKDARSIQLIGLEVRARLLAGEAVFVHPLEQQGPSESDER